MYFCCLIHKNVYIYMYFFLPYTQKIYIYVFLLPYTQKMYIYIYMYFFLPYTQKFQGLSYFWSIFDYFKMKRSQKNMQETIFCIDIQKITLYRARTN